MKNRENGVTELARALPEQIVVPYPNMPKRQYPKNRADSPDGNAGKEALGAGAAHRNESV